MTHGFKNNKNVRFIFYISWYSSLSDNKNNDLVLVREKRISKTYQKILVQITLFSLTELSDNFQNTNNFHKTFTRLSTF